MASTVAKPVDADMAQLLDQVHRLELVARHNVSGLQPGDYLTAVKGRGLVFHECRKYVPGEPARSIDWNITARTGEPHVRVHLEERQRQVFIALDVSPSMFFGTRRRTKLELGVELAASLAVSAQQAGDRLGHVLFADQIVDESRPQGGGKQVFRVLKSLLENTGPWRRPVAESDPRAAVHGIQKYRGRYVIFLISDFIDHDVPEDLKYLQTHHDVSLLHVYDPMEYAVDAPLAFRGRSPEGREAGWERWRRAEPSSSGSLTAMQEFLRQQCAPQGIAVHSFSTDAGVRSGLEAFFHRKRGLGRA